LARAWRLGPRTLREHLRRKNHSLSYRLNTLNYSIVCNTHNSNPDDVLHWLRWS
jgi:hypothetical protein